MAQKQEQGAHVSFFVATQRATTAQLRPFPHNARLTRMAFRSEFLLVSPQHGTKAGAGRSREFFRRNAACDYRPTAALSTQRQADQDGIQIGIPAGESAAWHKSRSRALT